MFSGIAKKILIFVLASTYLACGPSAKFEGNSNARVNSRSSAPVSDDVEVRGAEGDEPVATEPVKDEPVQPEVVEIKPEPRREDIERIFIAAKDEVASLSFDQEYMEQSLVLKRERGNIEEKMTYVQVERKQVMKSFTQGSVGREVVENLNQGDLGIVDVLVVIDNSVSMAGEQKKVSERLPTLISEISLSNWQIRIVTTDPKDSCARKLIKKSDPNAEQIFKDSIIGVGTNGNGAERGVQTAIMGLNCSEAWLRPNSNIAILLVSDEDNCSNGTQCGENNVNNDPATLKTLLQSSLGGSARKLGDDARIYGIFRIPGDATCPSTEAPFEANVYKQLVVDSKGVFGSICANDYTQTFKQISLDIKSQLKSTFNLAMVPDSGSLKVSVNDLPLMSGKDYTLNGQSLVFINTPPANARIGVSYQVGSTPLVKEFDLGEQPGLIEQVMVTPLGGQGVILSPADYSVVGTSLVLGSAPSGGAEVRVSFRQMLPLLPKTFGAHKDAVSDSVKVKVNGLGVPASFDPVSGQVELLTAPLDLQVVEVSYQVPTVGVPTLRYIAELNKDLLRDAMAYDEATMEPVGLTYDGQAFVIDAADFVEGRRVKIRFRLLKEAGPYVFALPQVPSGGSVQVALASLDGQEATCLAEQIKVVEKKVYVSCDFGKLAKITLKYYYKGIKEQRFEIEGLTPAEAEQAQWQVSINDNALNNFTRQGNAIVFDESLLSEAKVKILVKFPRGE